MKQIKFLLIGILFGIVMTKSEAVSWFRIQEMFRFDSFQMYGIIGSAVVAGIIVVNILKRYQIKTIERKKLKLIPKEFSIPRYLFGGIIFGLGWSITGACPGPMFTLLGHGILSILVVIFSSILGTFVYGIIKSKLPH